MLEIHYKKLDPISKQIYFEAAANPILQQLLNEELQELKTNLELIEKRSDESYEEFHSRFAKISINIQLIKQFIEINKLNQQEIQQSTKEGE